MSLFGMRYHIGEWVVFSSGSKGFSRFPHEAWKNLPEDLSWMRRLYVQQYLENKLHLEPSVDVDVHGMTSKSDSSTQLLKEFWDRPS
jgi:hypothetical protein